MRRFCLAALVIALLPAPADAHVAASPDTNNRYIKLTPMTDRVRVSYTVLIGDQPGAVARQALDVDGDRQVSEAEADRWGRDLAERVRAQLAITIDGAVVPLSWTDVYVGLGTPAVDAGSFSLDLIAWSCAPRPTGRHEVELIDRFALQPAGETEVKIEDQPGIHIEVAKVGEADMVGHAASFQRNAAPLGEGLRLIYRGDGKPLDDGRCPRAAESRSATPRWPWLVGGVVALVMVASLGLASFCRSREA